MRTWWQAVPLSFDHKPSSQIEIDRITRAGGYITEQGAARWLRAQLWAPS